MANERMEVKVSMQWTGSEGGHYLTVGAHHPFCSMIQPEVSKRIYMQIEM